MINGTRFTADELVARIRALQDAYRDMRHEVIERVDTPGRLAVAFVLRGVHTGPLATPLGPVAATGRPFETRVIDVLTLIDGRIAVITMVADELGRLRALGADHARLNPAARNGPFDRIPVVERALRMPGWSVAAQRRRGKGMLRLRPS